MADTPSASLDRRDVFRLGLLAAAAGLAPAAAVAQDQTPPPPPLRVVVEIPGAPDASRAILAVEIDPVEIEIKAHGRERDGSFRVFHPGDAHFGHASFTSACTLGGSKELQGWFEEVAKGKNIRKNITVTLFQSDKSPGR